MGDSGGRRECWRYMLSLPAVFARARKEYSFLQVPKVPGDPLPSVGRPEGPSTCGRNLQPPTCATGFVYEAPIAFLTDIQKLLFLVASESRSFYSSVSMVRRPWCRIF